MLLIIAKLSNYFVFLSCCSYITVEIEGFEKKSTERNKRAKAVLHLYTNKSVIYCEAGWSTRYYVAC